jgi:hypothetical protein
MATLTERSKPASALVLGERVGAVNLLITGT